MKLRNATNRRSFTAGLRILPWLLPALLAAGACGKKESGGQAPAPAVEATPLPPAPEEVDRQEPGREPAGPGGGAGGPAAVTPTLPPESAAGGAALWVTAPDLGRSVDRVAALLERLRAAGGDLAALLPAAGDLRPQAELMLRGALFGQLLGLGDPSVVDLSQPVRMRLSFPSAGGPSIVVSLGTVRPLEAMRTASLSGVTAPDGRYLVGLGVEPDPTTTWLAEAPEAAADDLHVVVQARSALPALVRAFGELQAGAARLGGAEPLPPWLGDLVLQTVTFAVEAAGIERLSLGLSLPAAEADPPLRVRFGLRVDPASQVGAAMTALGDDPPPFGLLESLDAGAEMWLAARMNPEAMRRYMALLADPMERFVAESLGEEWRAQTIEVLRAMVEAYAGTDGRTAVTARTLANGRGAFSILMGQSGDPAGLRAALRRGFAAAAGLLQKVSDKYSFGASITWTESAARVGGTEVDRLTVVVPRAGLGAAMAAALQPGTGDLRWEISVAVTQTVVAMTSDTDPTTLQRMLSGRGQGGGAASGSVLASRLATPEPGLVELGWLDFAASFRNNPALSCPADAVFPTLPMHIEALFAPGGFDMVMDFLPDGVGSVGAFVQAVQSCVPSAPPPPPQP
ncbi:MAG: hypothetical protein JXB32_01700 [Deltaproteobacteria bacterium]|nr:hypothetical protein [Deltaproteobacteria bacterium]